MNIDRATNEELLSTGNFEVMSLQADEDEHSIEMHLPYLAKVGRANINRGVYENYGANYHLAL